MTTLTLDKLWIWGDPGEGRRKSTVLTEEINRYFFLPNTTASIFEFDVKIHSCQNVELRFGVEEGIPGNTAPNVLVRVWGYLHYEHSWRVFEQIEFPPLKEGDIGTMIVNKKKKTISIRANNGEPFVLFENVCFPEALSMYIGEGEQLKLDFEELEKEEEERIDFVLSGDPVFTSPKVKRVKIPFLNKSIRVFSSLLLRSKIPVEDENFNGVFNEFSKHDLNVDERIIFDLLRGKGDFVKLSNSQIVDYYLFFRGIGLKYPLKSVVDQVSSVESFYESFLLFQEICTKKFENDVVNSWFTETPKQVHGDVIDATTFGTSLALKLFIVMKDKEDDLKKNQFLFSLKYIGMIILNIQKMKEKMNHEMVYEHKDFENVKFEEHHPFEGMKRLRSGIIPNVYLKCPDGVSIPSHREILVSRLNFFHLMLSFGGHEKKEIVEKGEIVLETISSRLMNKILDYVYTNKIDPENVQMEDVFKLISFSDMYSEKRLFIKILDLLGSLEADESMAEILCKFGHYLEINKELKKQVILKILSIDSSLGNNEKKVKKLIRRSFNNHRYNQLHVKMDNMNNKFTQQELEIEKLKDENTKMRGLIESGGSSSEDSSVLGGGMVRKRENDDSEVEKEFPKKKRKLDVTNE